MKRELTDEEVPRDAGNNVFIGFVKKLKIAPPKYKQEEKELSKGDTMVIIVVTDH